MKRVTKKDSAGHYYMTGDGVFLVRSVRDRFMGEDVDAVGAIEDILGDDYDMDRLRELVEADRDGRCVVFQPGHPVVSEYYKEGDFCIREATGVISKKEYMDRLKGEQDERID